ncbi:pyruvate orthophosphate dikinase [Actinidia rufa]|uniref:Pyruvate orthophosphate dikinase n=1 Tax=Actinidia rufa TaxID=165716 RepID=A0A7J0EGY2_9ERIC|nr:pyruvate orthophosphate dikinase [Actinidia rufa]
MPATGKAALEVHRLCIAQWICAMAKQVFTFGKGKSEGNKGMKSLVSNSHPCISRNPYSGFDFGLFSRFLTDLFLLHWEVKERTWQRWLALVCQCHLGLPYQQKHAKSISRMAKKLPDGLWEEILEGLESVEKDMGAFLGDPSKPLLLSVRSGAAVMDIPHSLFEEKLENLKYAKGAKLDTELSASDLKELVEQYKNVYLESKSEKVSFSPRAIKYRSINQITRVKGYSSEHSMHGVWEHGKHFGNRGTLHSEPKHWERMLVAGIRTPEHLDTMKSCMPEAYKELVENCKILERHYKDMMDIEFTVQENRLWMLQCRSGKRTGKGAVKIAVDMVDEGLVDTRTSIKMVEPQHLDQLLHPQPGCSSSPGSGFGCPRSIWSWVVGGTGPCSGRTQCSRWTMTWLAWRSSMGGGMLILRW